MGFAASQCRLLLLTARKSDLEYRAMQITNAKMILAMQTEECAREYSDALSNQTVKYVGTGGSNNLSLENLSAAQLAALSGGKYRFAWKDQDGNFTELNTDSTYKDADGNIISKDEYDAAVGSGATGYTEIPGENVSGQDMYNAIQHGFGAIVSASGQEISLAGNNPISSGYDTSDDNAAEAKYKAKTAQIQVKEKRLDMELVQVQSQHKAVEAEMESVKKLVEKNAESGFKVFS